VPVPHITAFAPPIGGAPGKVIEIIGSGFGDVISVKFGAVAAQFTILNSHVIRATVPATATTGYISVASPAGVATSARIFTVR
jgi:hypothetical protein